MHKSTINWLRLCDINTKYFHTSTLVRRRRNKIELLKDDYGVWIGDQQWLEDMEIHYYSSLFSSDFVVGRSYLRGHFSPLQPTKICKLQEDYSNEEIFQSRKGKSPYKSPCPNGFQVCFFQRTWAGLQGLQSSLW